MLIRFLLSFMVLVLVAGCAIPAKTKVTKDGFTARPQNSTFDIGAYEYIVAAGGSGGMTTTPAWDTPRRFHLWRR